MDKELLTAHVDEYFEQLVINAAEAARMPKLRTPLAAQDLPGFFKLVGQAIETQQKQEGVSKPIVYTEEFPDDDDNIKGEIVTYSLHSRKPGTFEAKGISQAMYDRNIRSRVRMLRDVQDDPDHPGMKVVTYGQEFDNIVCFKIWALKNKTANARAMWFEKLMEDWHWFFQASGVKRVHFFERGEDEHLAPEHRKLVCRPYYYYVRTEKVSVVKEYSLRSLVSEIST